MTIVNKYQYHCSTVHNLIEVLKTEHERVTAASQGIHRLGICLDSIDVGVAQCCRQTQDLNEDLRGDTCDLKSCVNGPKNNKFYFLITVLHDMSQLIP